MEIVGARLHQHIMARGQRDRPSAAYDIFLFQELIS